MPVLREATVAVDETSLTSGSQRQCRRPLAGALRQWLKVPFSEFAKRVGDGTGRVKHDRPISDRPAPESITDHVHGAVGRPARDPSPGAGPVLFIVEPKRELELHVP